MVRFVSNESGYGSRQTGVAISGSIPRYWISPGAVWPFHLYMAEVPLQSVGQFIPEFGMSEADEGISALV